MRYYSTTAGEMVLQLGVTAGETSITVNTTAGLPVTFPYALILDYGAAGEEVVDVTAAAGVTLTVTRGRDGTVAQAHAFGAKIRHGMTARDLRESREHEAATAAHGVGTIVGTTETQALTNKDLSSATNTLPATVATNATVTANAATVTAHTGATAAHGATGAVVGTTNTQTLTNKTIDGASNTLTNVPQAAVTGLPAAVTLVGAVDTRLAAVETNIGSQTTFAGTSAAKDGKKIHWSPVNFTTDASGLATITHGAGFTPNVVLVNLKAVGGSLYDVTRTSNYTATTFDVRVLDNTGASAASVSLNMVYICLEG